MVLALFSAAVAWLFVPNPSVAPRAGAALSGVPASASGTGAGPAASSGLSGALARVAADSPRRRVEVIIQLRRGVDAASARALVRSLGG